VRAAGAAGWAAGAHMLSRVSWATPCVRDARHQTCRAQL